MNGVLIIALAIGIFNLIMGYMRRYKGKVFFILPQFKEGSHKRIYSRFRGTFDICYGLIMIIAGLLYQFLEPNLHMFFGVLIFVLAIALIVFYSVLKKHNIPYL